jgi:hypothetical protein
MGCEVDACNKSPLLSHSAIYNKHVFATESVFVLHSAEPKVRGKKNEEKQQRSYLVNRRVVIALIVGTISRIAVRLQFPPLLAVVLSRLVAVALIVGMISRIAVHPQFPPLLAVVLSRLVDTGTAFQFLLFPGTVPPRLIGTGAAF